MRQPRSKRDAELEEEEASTSDPLQALGKAAALMGAEEWRERARGLQWLCRLPHVLTTAATTAAMTAATGEWRAGHLHH